MKNGKGSLNGSLETGLEIDWSSVIHVTAVIMPILAISLAIFLFGGIAISISGRGVREGAMVPALAPLAVAPERALAICVSYGLAGMCTTAILGSMSYIMLLPEWGALIGTDDDSNA